MRLVRDVGRIGAGGGGELQERQKKRNMNVWDVSRVGIVKVSRPKIVINGGVIG